MIIGITGGIGSGKSAISNQLRALGYAVYDSDREAKRLIHEHAWVREQIIELFGEEVFVDNVYQTPLVAQRVFADPALLARLNAIVHPAVREDIVRRYMPTPNSDKAGDRLMFIECAILYEAGIDALCDKVVCVTAPEQVRLERVIQRDNSNIEKVRARMRAQKAEEYEQRADIVLNNDGTTPLTTLCQELIRQLNMNYQQTLSYLYASQPAFHLVGAAAYKPGLDNTYRLMEHLGNPHEQLRAVHVAGTNGKGSTSHLIAATLQAQGYKVGLFTSPHLVDFRERIRISGQMIEEQTVVDFVAANRAFLDDLRPSFFETTMALAFWYFAQQQVDIAVVEVGLGGRLDSTNILTPLLSVITNIGIDHTEFLGTTLPQIAAEKAGIIKPHVPCVIGETHPDTQAVFLSRAEECEILAEGLETTDCRLWFADQCGYMRKRRKKEAPECQLTGNYQDKNQQTAFVALQVLRNFCGIEISKEALAEGFAHVCTLTGLRGRWEVLSQRPLIVCDTGHNGHGMRYVAEQLTSFVVPSPISHSEASNSFSSSSSRLLASSPSLHLILGMVDDKDVDTVLEMLPEGAICYFTQAQTKRALPASELLSRWKKLHADSIAMAFETVKEAIDAARAVANEEDMIFIGGSNYVVGEALGVV